MSHATQHIVDTNRYAKCIEVSKRVRFDIDEDVVRGRQFDASRKFLPDGLSKVGELTFLNPEQKKFLSQIQGRTYANTFGLVERFIAPKITEVSRDHWLGDQVAFEALVRFTDEELKHQELFRRLDRMAAEVLPAGYDYKPQPNEVASAVLAASNWAVLGLICHIEIFVLSHYRSSIEPEQTICPLWKDVFLHHAREESQHAIMDEMEWLREDATLTAEARDKAVDDLIGLVGAVDGILQAQAKSDADYFLLNAGAAFTSEQAQKIHDTVLKAYRWQYIVSGVQEPRFLEVLGSMITAEQGARINDALAPIVQS
jgi:hypothetical protein